jgi:hypothetical protein
MSNVLHISTTRTVVNEAKIKAVSWANTDMNSKAKTE